MRRGAVLDAARDAVTRDREATHGDARATFAQVADLWSALLGVALRPDQVALMLDQVKTVRAWGNPGHADNWVDKAGYSALGGELAAEPQEPRAAGTSHGDGWDDVEARQRCLDLLRDMQAEFEPRVPGLFVRQSTLDMLRGRVRRARAGGQADPVIRAGLVAERWSPDLVARAMEGAP